MRVHHVRRQRRRRLRQVRLDPCPRAASAAAARRTADAGGAALEQRVLHAGAAQRAQLQLHRALLPTLHAVAVVNHEHTRRAGIGGHATVVAWGPPTTLSGHAGAGYLRYGSGRPARPTGREDELRRGRLALARLAEVERELALVRHHQDAKVAELEERLGWIEEHELDLRDAAERRPVAGARCSSSGRSSVRIARRAARVLGR